MTKNDQNTSIYLCFFKYEPGPRPQSPRSLPPSPRGIRLLLAQRASHPPGPTVLLPGEGDGIILSLGKVRDLGSPPPPLLLLPPLPYIHVYINTYIRTYVHTYIHTVWNKHSDAQHTEARDHTCSFDPYACTAATWVSLRLAEGVLRCPSFLRRSRRPFGDFLLPDAGEQENTWRCTLQSLWWSIRSRRQSSGIATDSGHDYDDIFTDSGDDVDRAFCGASPDQVLTLCLLLSLFSLLTSMRHACHLAQILNIGKIEVDLHDRMDHTKLRSVVTAEKIYTAPPRR